MEEQEQKEEKQEKKKKRRVVITKEQVKRMNMLNNDFFYGVYDDNKEAVEYTAQVLTDKPDLTVKEFHLEHVIKAGPDMHEVQLDIFAVDGSGRRINIELQKRRAGYSPNRLRRNASMLDWESYRKDGEDYDKLPETYTIMICNTDVVGLGKALYHVDRMIDGKIPFDDGSHIIIANAKCADDGTPIGDLMHDMRSRSLGKAIRANCFKERIIRLKDDKEGGMSSLFEKYGKERYEEGLEEGHATGRAEGLEEGHATGKAEGRAEGRAEAIDEMIVRMHDAGHPHEEIAKVTDSTIEHIDNVLAAKAGD